MGPGGGGLGPKQKDLQGSGREVELGVPVENHKQTKKAADKIKPVGVAALARTVRAQTCSAQTCIISMQCRCSHCLDGKERKTDKRRSDYWQPDWNISPNISDPIRGGRPD